MKKFTKTKITDFMKNISIKIWKLTFFWISLQCETQMVN